jgi:hypothetical protein
MADISPGFFTVKRFPKFFLGILCAFARVNWIALIYYFVIFALFAVKNFLSSVLVLDKHPSPRRD